MRDRQGKGSPGLSRRHFGKSLLGAFFIGSRRNTLSASSISRVVFVQSPLLKRQKHLVNKIQAVNFINKSLIRITGKTDSTSAWRSLFSSRETVGLKLSCLPGKPLSSSMGVVYAVVDNLIKAGVKERNIIIWERTGRELTKAGYILAGLGVKVMGTDSLPGGGYSANVEVSGSVGTCFSRIMEQVDAIINVPVLKDHDIAGVSIGLKNFYGAIHNPNKFHGNNCNPFVADLCKHPLIRKKLRLTVCDATRIQVNNGPAYFSRYVREFGGLLISRDPVALDYIGWQIIERERKKMALPSLKDAGREPVYIKTAADNGLGQGNPAAIELVRIGSAGGLNE